METVMKTVSLIKSVEPVRIQTLDKFIINHHPFGAGINKFCKDNADIAMRSGNRTRKFFHGGDFPFVIAMQDYLSESVETQLYRIGCHGSWFQTVLQVINKDGVALYIDGDGLATEQDLADKTYFCTTTETCELAFFSPEKAEAYACKLLGHYKISRSQELTKQLRSEFGCFNIERLDIGPDSQRKRVDASAIRKLHRAISTRVCTLIFGDFFNAPPPHSFLSPAASQHEIT